MSQRTKREVIFLMLLIFSRLSELCLTQRITRLLRSLAATKFPVCAGAYFLTNKMLVSIAASTESEQSVDWNYVCKTDK